MTRRLFKAVLVTALASSPSALAFQPPTRNTSVASRAGAGAGAGAGVVVNSPRGTIIMASSSTTSAASGTENVKENKSYLYVPAERDEHYQGNIAQYLLDLHEEKATFDFCGGMMFQLVLTDKLQSHLRKLASNNDSQPTIHDASMPRMSQIPNYTRSAFADNLNIFHGRELRKIPTANGGMGFVLQLSYADPSSSSSKAVDPQGWSTQEIEGYDGWRHDVGRQWRKAAMYEDEGFENFSNEFDKDAYGLHHRFYLHYDNGGRMWLSAEDGCEGTPSPGRNLIGKLGGLLFGI